MAWKLKRKIKKLNENHSLDLFISVPLRDMKKRNFIILFSRYQSVIIANVGFAP